MLDTVQKGLYTNLNLQQMIALGNFAMGVNADKIGSYTMSGKIQSALDWNFCFLNQDYRSEIISKVYGQQAEPQKRVSYEYAVWLGKNGFTTVRYLTTAHEVFEYAKARTASMSEEQKTAYDHFVALYNETQAAYEKTSDSLLEKDNTELLQLCAKLKDSTEKLAELFSYSEKLVWKVQSKWYEDSCINEVNVNFQ